MNTATYHMGMRQIEAPARQRLRYPLSEVAWLLGLSIYTVRRDVRRGDIKVVRHGRRVLVPASEIERIIAFAEARAERR